jgi:hypothetical protein
MLSLNRNLVKEPEYNVWVNSLAMEYLSFNVYEILLEAHSFV